MSKRGRRTSVSRNRYREYQTVAEHFFAAANDALELEYWTAAGLLIVHSAIAYTDALCVQQSGQKSSGENHEDAIALLDEESPAGTRKRRRSINYVESSKRRLKYHTSGICIPAHRPETSGSNSRDFAAGRKQC